MPPFPDRTDVTPLVEQLALEPDAQRRDRLLLDTARELTEAGAVALWSETSLGWSPRMVLGPPALLPDSDLLEAVADGTFDPDLPARGRILVSGEAPRRAALTLGDLPCEGADTETRGMLLEALLMVWSLIEAASASAPGDDLILPPVPADSVAQRRGVHRPVPDPDAAELRRRLHRIRSTESALAREQNGLSSEELEVLCEALDRECQRVGDLLLNGSCDPERDPPHGCEEPSADDGPASAGSTADRNAPRG